MVEGISAYYPRFGFERASALGFISPHPKIPDEAFLVKRLPGYSPDLAGRIVYPPSTLSGTNDRSEKSGALGGSQRA
jgi:predicted N-acetyltransferase YhbS